MMSGIENRRAISLRMAESHFPNACKTHRTQDDLAKEFSTLLLAGAGGIEPRNNPLPHKDFSIPARPFDSIFDSKAKALVGMTDDEVAYIEAKGWKASFVPELSIPPLRELLWIKRRSFEVRHARRRLPAESALMSAARGNADSFCSARAFPSLTDAVEKVFLHR